MKTNILWLILVFVSFIGCKGGGSDNKELSEQTFGLQIKKVSGDNQVLENPARARPLEKGLNTVGVVVGMTRRVKGLDYADS